MAETWKGRAFKVEEGCFKLSARGDLDDWDTSELRAFPAFTGNVGVGEVRGLKVLDEERLLIETTCGDYVLVGDPSEGGFVEKFEDDTADFDVLTATLLRSQWWAIKAALLSVKDRSDHQQTALVLVIKLLEQPISK